MDGSGETLETSKENFTLLKHWTCRQFLMLLLALGATIIAYVDPSFRNNYADLIKFSLGGYLGQMLPKGKDNY